MGLYTVLRPCMVGDLHYAQVPAGHIIADDTVAAPLVKSGDLAAVGTTPVGDDEKPATKPDTSPHRRRADKEA